MSDVGLLALACACAFLLTVVAGLYWAPLKSFVSQWTEGDLVTVARVIDGDTLELAGGERVRILNIDTAEMPPRSGCLAEAQLALAAKARLTGLTAGARRVSMTRDVRDRDVYGRLLRRVEVDGRDVGRLLIEEGLAQPWRGAKADWC